MDRSRHCRSFALAMLVRMLDWARESQSELKSGARRVSDGFGRYSYLPVYWYYPVLTQ